MREHVDGWTRRRIEAACALLVMCAATLADGAELRVGAATISITPDRPVALAGQMHTRIAKQVATPCTAAALAFESRDGERPVDAAILVACDLVAIQPDVLIRTRRRLKELLPDFNSDKLVLSATHTHTAPVTDDSVYEIPTEGVLRPPAYVDFLVERFASVAAQAWNARDFGSVGWGLGHAVIAQNRRATYADTTAKMYGNTAQKEFRGIEGYEDHGVEVLCVFDKHDKLMATAINVACPAQEVEGESQVNADFWHQVREQLRAAHGENLVVLGWTGAGGDQSPHLMFRKQAEERMRALRKLSRLEELAGRIVRAWEEAHAGAKQELHRDARLVHKVERIELPPRTITPRDVELAKQQIAALPQDSSRRWRTLWHQSVVDRFEKQQSGTLAPYEMELHVLRIGDVAITTNEFELFTEYGVQIKARSPALQTFVIQLTGAGGYVPTSRAVQGGGYSAIAESGQVGPEGGQVMVDRTLELIQPLWEAK